MLSLREETFGASPAAGRCIGHEMAFARTGVRLISQLSAKGPSPAQHESALTAHAHKALKAHR